MDPYVILTYRSQEHRSSVAKGMFQLWIYFLGYVFIFFIPKLSHYFSIAFRYKYLKLKSRLK